MLKLNASFSKKVPAEAEYSSQSYHASIEVELPDGLSQNQLQDKIHETFELVRNSVENELHTGSISASQDVNNQSQGGYTAPPKTSHPAGQNANHSGGNLATPASSKQITYLLDLARQRGLSPQQIASQYNVSNIQRLTRRQCSEIINSWKVA